jgi:hypothetical protein
MPDAVVLPGGAFGPAAGLLLYAGAVARERAIAMAEFLDLIDWPGRAGSTPGDD